MAAGDYGPGAVLSPVMVNVTFDDRLRIAECGIGYHIVTPSGRRHVGGFTWHRGSSGETAPAGSLARLQALMDELLAAAAAHEGVELSLL